MLSARRPLKLEHFKRPLFQMLFSQQLLSFTTQHASHQDAFPYLTFAFRFSGRVPFRALALSVSRALIQWGSTSCVLSVTPVVQDTSSVITHLSNSPESSADI